MPSRLEDFKAVLEAAFVAATPAFPPTDDPDGGLAYRWIDTLTEERGNGQHRQLIWGKPDRPAVLARHWPVLDWKISATLFLHRRDRTDALFTVASTSAMYELHRAWRRQAAIGWGAGIVANLDPPTVNDGEGELQPRAGGVRRTSTVLRIAFPFRVAVREAS